MNKLHIILFLLLLLLSAYSYAQVVPQPNIIFIVVDDLNDYVDGYNSLPLASTPNINRISANGTQFLNAVNVSPLCCPSRTSFLTGKDTEYTQIYSASNYNCTDFSQNFSEENNNATYYTIPGYLKDSAGYFTYGLNKIFHCYENFQEYDSLTADPCAKSLSWNKVFVYNDTTVLKPGILFEEQGVKNNEWAKMNDSLEPYMMDVQAVDASIEFINNFASGEGTCGKPFFLALGIKKPHKPLYIPEKYFDAHYVDDFTQEPFNIPYNFPSNAYPLNGIILPPQPDISFEDYDSLPENGMGQEMVKGADENFEKWATDLNDKPEINPNYSELLTLDILGWSKRANCVMAYVAAINYLDTQIGRLLDGLAENPEVYNNTVIVFIGDNGYSLGEKRHWGKRAMWETDNRVPFIIADLRNPEQNVTPTTVSLLDIFPTICDLAGINPPTFNDGQPYLDGNSLLPLMVEPHLQIDRPQLASVKKEINNEGYCFPQYAVRNDRFHYIRYQSNGGGYTLCDFANSYFEEELYEIGVNRDVDPNEWNNLIALSAYQPVTNYLAQWLPGGAMYMQPAYKSTIINDELDCYLPSNTILPLTASIFDTLGNSIEHIEGKYFAWTNNLSNDTLFGQSVDFNFGNIPAELFIDNADLFIYFSIIDSLSNKVVGFDLKQFKVGEAVSPIINYNLFAAGNNLVYITDFSLQGDYNNWWWEINGDSVFYNSTPGPISVTTSDSVTVTCNVTYGNNDCLVFETKSTIPKPENYYNNSLLCFPNPANNEILVVNTNGLLNGDLVVYSLSGNAVEKINLIENNSSTYYINTTNYSNGAYIITFTGNKNTVTNKLIIMHNN